MAKTLVRKVKMGVVKEAKVKAIKVSVGEDWNFNFSLVGADRATADEVMNAILKVAEGKDVKVGGGFTRGEATQREV